MDVRQKVIKGINTYLQFWKGQPVVDYNPPTGPDYTEPFYVENITDANETLSIVKSNASAPTLTIEYSTDRVNWSVLGKWCCNFWYIHKGCQYVFLDNWYQGYPLRLDDSGCINKHE